MKTLCYKVAFKLKNHIYDEGFIIVKINDNNSISKIEGLLTFDYLNFVIIDSKIEIKIYSKDTGKKVKYGDLSRNDKIIMTSALKIILPLNKFTLPFDFEFSDNEGEYELKTIDKVSSSLDINRYERYLEEYKQNVFIDERR